MRRELDHRPARKQRELERVLQIVFKEFGDAMVLARHEWKRAGRILKVILYRSYARGSWIDVPHTAKACKSGYELLLIVSDKRLTDRVKYWSNLDDRLMPEFRITGSVSTPLKFLVHTLNEVSDGLALYEANDTELHAPKPKRPSRRY